MKGIYAMGNVGLIYAIFLVVALVSAVRADVASYVAFRPTSDTSTELNISGIPFVKAECWSPAHEGESFKIDASGLQAESLYVLGGVNSVDLPNPGWGGGNGFENFFIGDTAGNIKIYYKSKTVDTVPLIFGYTIWWRAPYNIAPEPFKTDAKARALLDRALCVAGGIDGGEKPYFVKIKLRNEPIDTIVFDDNPAKVGHPVIDGVTFGGVGETTPLNNSLFSISKGSVVDSSLAKWLKTHTVDSTDSFPAHRRKALHALGRLMYTYPEDISSKVIRATKPDITEENYPGPKVRFGGTTIAELLTNIYYENSYDMLGRVGDDGMVHESGVKADNYSGFGGYNPGLQPFYNTSYTRLRALTLLSNVGFDIEVQKAINYFDRWLMYFPRSFPDIQMEGKPVPGHATVIANTPHVYFDSLRHGGWPTKYTTRDYGNPETDGHGMMMLTRWRAWVKDGRKAEWIKKHWEALNEAAEWIPWCLDNPNLSFSEHGLLYAESEGGMQIASLYCNVPCYLGLLAYADMADVAGRSDKAQRWREQAQRLFTAMNAYFPTRNDSWGDVWDPIKSGGWGPATSFAPIIHAVDLFGYDAMSCMPESWAERTRNTYKMQLPQVKPQWCAPAGMGYNQCYYTEASLLLDEMSDATNFVDWMARFCFAPRMPHPYRTPEGAVIAGDKSVWRRWGDLGNLYQMAEVVYAIQIILGIDDLDASCPKLMPRIPIGWTDATINEWPIRAMASGESILTRLSVSIKRDPACKRFDMTITTKKPLDKLKVRLGPFSENASALTVKVNGTALPAQLVKSGDSKWTWIELKGAADYSIESRVK